MAVAVIDGPCTTAKATAGFNQKAIEPGLVEPTGSRDTGGSATNDHDCNLTRHEYLEIPSGGGPVWAAYRIRMALALATVLAVRASPRRKRNSVRPGESRDALTAAEEFGEIHLRSTSREYSGPLPRRKRRHST